MDVEEGAGPRDSLNIKFLREPSFIQSTRGANPTELGADDLSSQNFGFGKNA